MRSAAAVADASAPLPFQVAQEECCSLLEKGGSTALLINPSASLQALCGAIRARLQRLEVTIECMEAQTDGAVSNITIALGASVDEATLLVDCLSDVLRAGKGAST